MEERNLYLSFLDLEKEIKVNGGNIENRSEIEVFSKIYKNLDIVFANSNLAKGVINKKNKNIYQSSTFNNFIPVFGKRAFLNWNFLRKYKYVIISDSRNIIAFIQALFLGKRIIFKSHGSNSVMFFSYLKADLLNSELNLLNILIKIFYYIPIIIIFFLIELFVFVFSEKIYIMRSKESLFESFWGRLYCFLFSYKTEYSFFCYLRNMNFEFNKSIKEKINKTEDNRIVLLGNWKIIHNFGSICEFIKRFHSSKKTKIYVVGNITQKQIYLLDILLKRSPYEYEITGYKEDLTFYKKIATHIVACSHYGSGIPIKAVQILYESFKYGYIPYFSDYCRKSLVGLIDDNLRTYPNKGIIYFDN